MEPLQCYSTPLWLPFFLSTPWFELLFAYSSFISLYLSSSFSLALLLLLALMLATYPYYLLFLPSSIARYLIIFTTSSLSS
jgi:hypothetical protein